MVGTAYYYDKAGTAKVVHGVSFRTTPSAQWIRGFQALQPVRVYNFSLMDSPSVPVQFWVVPVDEQDVNPLADKKPELISQTKSGKLGPQGMTTVQSAPWTAKTVDGNAMQKWRIFVVVDPDGKNVNGHQVDEIHPLKGRPPCPKDSQRLAGTRLLDATPGHSDLHGRAGIPTIRVGHTVIGEVHTTSKVTATGPTHRGSPADLARKMLGVGIGDTLLWRPQRAATIPPWPRREIS